MTTWAGIVAYLATSLGPTGGSVLCIGSDGHLLFEPAVAERWADWLGPVGHCNEADRKTALTSVDRDSCIDLSFDGVDLALHSPKSQLRGGASPRTHLTLAPNRSADSLPSQTGGMAATGPVAGDTQRLSLRAVVLLI